MKKTAFPQGNRFQIPSGIFPHRPATCAIELRPIGAFEIGLQFKRQLF